jgi:hypothetical protein
LGEGVTHGFAYLREGMVGRGEKTSVGGFEGEEKIRIRRW